MILVPHALVGAAIMNMLPNHPVIGASLAFASHYALDAVPHSDYAIDGLIEAQPKTFNSIWKNTRARLSLLMIGLDFCSAGILCFLIFVRNEQSLILTAIGAFAGMLPDLLQFFHMLWKKEPFVSLQKVHDRAHNPDKMENRKVQGFLIQFAFALGVIILFFFVR